jgi:hypothetical protein
MGVISPITLSCVRRQRQLHSRTLGSNFGNVRCGLALPFSHRECQTRPPAFNVPIDIQCDLHTLDTLLSVWRSVPRKRCDRTPCSRIILGGEGDERIDADRITPCQTLCYYRAIRCEYGTIERIHGSDPLHATASTRGINRYRSKSYYHPACLLKREGLLTGDFGIRQRISGITSDRTDLCGRTYRAFARRASNDHGPSRHTRLLGRAPTPMNTVPITQRNRTMGRETDIVRRWKNGSVEPYLRLFHFSDSPSMTIQ